mmetsp:Transcript_44486/g.135603  ORF Transcript_44486/g.135603 Transcript_44486/m.135603 type:complete len:85 (+) Transcript_44486:141-395(+)
MASRTQHIIERKYHRVKINISSTMINFLRQHVADDSTIIRCSKDKSRRLALHQFCHDIFVSIVAALSRLSRMVRFASLPPPCLR